MTSEHGPIRRAGALSSLKQSLRHAAWAAARWADEAVVGHLSLRKPGPPGLLILTTHALYADPAEAESGIMDPQQALTTDGLDRAITTLLALGYRFVAPDDIASLGTGERAAMLTFDDGYANNARVLPVLERHRVPAIVVVATDYVAHGRAFWWDVLYRQGRRIGLSRARLAKWGQALKGKGIVEIERELLDAFPGESLQPVGELDRPFTWDELRAFAASPWVHLGNHTTDHENLTLLDEESILGRVRDAGDVLEEVAGKRPTVLAYPYGSYDRRVQSALQKSGVAYGLTVAPIRNALPVPPGSPAALELGRHTLWGHRSIERQLAAYRSDLSLLGSLARRKRGRSA